jgi:transcriptional regulator with GAF, ATPase, and Fis domain
MPNIVSNLDLSAFERLLTDISARFVNATPANVDAEITGALRSLVEFLGIDRGTLFQWPAEGPHLVSTHHWVVEGCEPAPPFVPQQVLPYLLRKVLEGNPVSWSSLAEFPPEAAVDRMFLEQHGPKSNLSFPLVAGGPVLGALAFGTIRHERPWSDVLKDRLSVVAHIFANALARKRSDLALRRAYAEVARLKERLELDNQYLRQERATDAGEDGIVAQSAPMKAVLSEVGRVAATDATVMLSGETGTGKELLAEAVHHASKRRDRLLVRVNCAALPGPLIESELFGREKGAYTGALTRERGRFEVADGGTLFLDEVGELPLELQAKLLRVLEHGTFERLGSSRTVKANVRLVAATNRDLGQAVRDGRFRQDLFFRLQVFPIRIPPLRDRREDIPPLVWAFIKEFGRHLGKVIENVPRQSMEALRSYAWPGNVRELRNVIERSMILTDGPTLRVVLPDAQEVAQERGPASTLQEVEGRHILDVLGQTGWRISGSSGAARVLGIKPTTLDYRMKKLGIERKRLAARTRP